MNKIVKFASAAAVVGALAIAAATPGEARNGRNTAAAIGFGAGALVGAAVASSANQGHYYDGYAYDPGYEPGYAYEPAPVYVQPYDTYAHEPAPVYRYRARPAGKDMAGISNY